MFKTLLVLVASVCVVHASLALGPVPPKPEKFKDQEGCYIVELDQVIAFGASAPSKSSCMRYNCMGDMIQYENCGVAVAVPPCEVVSDPKKPYPNCCPKAKCPK